MTVEGVLEPREHPMRVGLAPSRTGSFDVSVVGNGYVGLITAVGLASIGHRLLCVERDATKVALINRGGVPIYEAGLADLLPPLISGGNLKASSDYDGILDTDLTFICVGTPCHPDGHLDLGALEHSVWETGTTLARKSGYHVVVVKSTVPPGTTVQRLIPLLEESSGKKVGQNLGVVVNPEFLQEGKALRCFMAPDRLIIGESDSTAGDLVREVHNHVGAPVIRTDLTTAEMIKYASNAFLATKISFINEIGNICQKLGVDAYDVAQGMGHDSRIGHQFLRAGVGYGGSCLPKDLQALISTGRKLGYEPRLLESVAEVNNAQIIRMVEMAEEKLGSLEGKQVAVLGLAFKPDTDDVREAPALRVLAALSERKALARAYDPIAMASAKKVLSFGVHYCDSAEEAVRDADCVLILTEWDEFHDEGLYVGKTVIDGRRILDRAAKEFCDYEGICW